PRFPVKGSGVCFGSRFRRYSESFCSAINSFVSCGWTCFDQSLLDQTATRRGHVPSIPAGLGVSSRDESAKHHFKGGFRAAEKLLHPGGGSTLRAGFPA